MNQIDGLFGLDSNQNWIQLDYYQTRIVESNSNNEILDSKTHKFT